MPSHMWLRIWDVEHGACAMLQHRINGQGGHLAMIDSGNAADWRPSTYIRTTLNRTRLDYLMVTNADQDHLSDLAGLDQTGVSVATMIRNRNISATDLREIKLKSGTPTNDIEKYLSMHGSYTLPVSEPFQDHMGGITYKMFANSYPEFKDTNNLSAAFFIKFGGFSILFPGDLEGPGWLKLLEDQNFRNELASVTVLVAAHHGRENGYCKEVFDYCKPRTVVISDKAITHGTQEMTPTYRQRVIDNYPDGVYVNTTTKNRHVLTTRRDGWIEFVVNDQGKFGVNTEYEG